jgi:hypothetical protein
VPPSIDGVHLMQKHLEVLAPLSRPAQQEPITSAEIQGSEDHALGIEPSETDAYGLSPKGPSSSQRWKQEEIGFIFYQQDTARR